MILKQKKKTEAERSMEENKRKSEGIIFLIMGVIMILGTAGMWLLGSLKEQAQDKLLGSCVFTLLLLAVLCFQLRREYVHDALDYDNGQNRCRFLLCVGIGLIIALVCGFLPAGGWPFLLVYIMLALFSNMATGILSASALLMISVLLSGETVLVFALYFVSGVFSVVMFRHLGKDFKIGIPLFLSILCLLVCETAGIVLVANARPDFEMFVIPIANVITCSILLLGCLKFFSSMVVYRYREIYLDINDTENPALTSLREENKKDYMLCIHTAYFCERIGTRLEMDVDALKCAGYYYRPSDRIAAMMEEKVFPPAVREILLDYLARKQGIRKRETAVLFCAETVVTSVTFMLEKSEQRQVDFDKVIDTVFRKMMEDGVFDKCNITMNELRTIQRIFKEEKLYYDFLR